jgi:hypothetical protein
MPVDLDRVAVGRAYLCSRVPDRVSATADPHGRQLSDGVDEQRSGWRSVVDTAPDGTDHPCVGVPDRGADTVMVSQELVFALARHKDADVTVAVGGILIDVCAVTYAPERDKYVLHLVADDLADALRKLAGEGPAHDHAARGAAGAKNHENGAD